MAKLILIAGLALIAWMWWRGKSSGTMTSAEARRLLDVSADASTDEIRAAHRRIIARVHPDAGGNAELARKINLARDHLLKSGVKPPQP